MYPVKCWVHVSGGGGGALPLCYNSHSSSNTQCNTDRQCLCRVTCSPGKYQNDDGQTSCKDCPMGHFQSSPSKGLCIMCYPGQYQDLIGQPYCKPCATGGYQNQVGQSSCKLCPSGTYRGGTGASSLTQCISCSAGRASNAGASTCTSNNACNNIDGSLDGSGNSFPVSSCLGTGTLKNDLTISCASTPCVETECCIQLLPNTELYWNDRSTGLRKVVDDWIAGGTERAAVEVKYGFIENWDTSAVTRMDYLFYGKSSLDADLSKCKFFVFFWFCLANVFNI